VADYAAQRRLMAEHQLKSRGIDDPRVLQVMGEVPRELFVPIHQKPNAYADGPLPIGHGQTISQPCIVALMTQSLRLEGAERVLELGTGSGYQTAILAQLAAHVYTVERIADLAERARELLEGRLGLQNISFKVGDGTLGWEEEAPFDRIIATAAAPHAPRALLSQLCPGGHLVAPVGSEYSQTLTRFTSDEEGRWRTEDICPCVFVKLVGKDGWPIAG